MDIYEISWISDIGTNRYRKSSSKVQTNKSVHLIKQLKKLYCPISRDYYCDH